MFSLEANPLLIIMKRLSFLICFLFIATRVSGANEPVIIQAESGVLGADIGIGSSGGANYIESLASATGTSPGSASRVVSYTVTFPAAGTYELYARLRVGTAGGNDDSFFYAADFGQMVPGNDSNWILANNLNLIGQTQATVIADVGTAGITTWKWVKLSSFNGGEAPVSFTVAAGPLTKTFQIATREDGLRLDRLAFGHQGIAYTVGNLDSGTSSSSVFVPQGPPLASGSSKFLGSVHSTSQVVNFPAYWNQVTPENAGKWGSVEGVRDVMIWSQLDAAYNFAKFNGYPFRMHVLVWGSQQPAWIESLAPAEQLAEIEEWFAAVAARYPDIDYLEVVNEPLHQPPSGAGTGNYLAALGGSGNSGWDWILSAFRLARQHFPGTPLVLNDYSVTNTNNSAIAYLGIVNLLLTESLIDIIGIQGHAFETTVPAATTKTNLDRLATAGLPLMVTELDIDGLTDEQQLESYRRIFPVFWDHPAVIGVTVWGYRPGMWRTDQGAPLVYTNNFERPALTWLRRYVRDLPSVIAPGQAFVVYSGIANNSFVGLARTAEANMDYIPLSWQIIGGNGAGIFSIEAATGVIRVANAAPLATAGSTYALTLRVTDEFGVSDPVNLSITVWPPDQDGDGMPDSFEQLHGGGPTSLGPVSDSDYDGLPAMIEYALGLNPSLPSGNGRPFSGTVLHQGQIYLTLTYRRSVSASQTAAMVVALSTELGVWLDDQTVPVSTVPAPGEPGIELVTVRSNLPLGSRPGEYLRVEARPLTP